MDDPVSEPIKVLVADAHAPTHARVRHTLERDGGFVICAESMSADQAVDATLAADPDVCLVDVDLPGGGISAVTRMVALRPLTTAIMLAVSSRDSELFDSLRAGASGYLLKDRIDLELADATRRVFAGEASLPGILVARLIEEFRDREGRRVRIADRQAARLTGREWTCSSCCVKGSARRRWPTASSCRARPSAATSRPCSTSCTCPIAVRPCGCSNRADPPRPHRRGAKIGAGGLRARWRARSSRWTCRYPAGWWPGSPTTR